MFIKTRFILVLNTRACLEMSKTFCLGFYYFRILLTFLSVMTFTWVFLKTAPGDCPLRLPLGYTQDVVRAKALLEYLTLSHMKIMNNADVVCMFMQEDSTGRSELTLGGNNTVCFLDTWDVNLKIIGTTIIDIKYSLNSPRMWTRVRYKTKTKNYGYFNKRFGDHVFRTAGNTIQSTVSWLFRDRGDIFLSASKWCSECHFQKVLDEPQSKAFLVQ